MVHGGTKARLETTRTSITRLKRKGDKNLDYEIETEFIDDTNIA